MTIDLHTSRRIAIYVNIAKLTLLAALTPPVVAGISERATRLGEGIDAATITATTVSIGSFFAIVGALSFGALADVGSRTIPSSWLWVLCGVGVGTIGLVTLALGETRSALTVGWAAAQFGYSGAMAVLRVLLAAALPTQRRRGAVVAILGGYGGMIIPLAVLLVAPGTVWQTTLGLASISFMVPLIFLTGSRKRHEVPALEVSECQQTEREVKTTLSRWVILTVQFFSNVVITVFLTYHPLDMAERVEGDGIPIRTSVWVIVAAVLGLIGSAVILLAKPRFLANSRLVIVCAGMLLAASLGLRALVDQLPLLMLAAAMSGCAVALNSSALFTGALDAAHNRTGGKLMGGYSAAGAAGQLIGPVAALAVIAAASGLLPNDTGEYRQMFLVLALVPAAWAFAVALSAQNFQLAHERKG